jgi:hypothetical protein
MAKRRARRIRTSRVHDTEIGVGPRTYWCIEVLLPKWWPWGTVEKGWLRR